MALGRGLARTPEKLRSDVKKAVVPGYALVIDRSGMASPMRFTLTPFEMRLTA